MCLFFVPRNKQIFLMLQPLRDFPGRLLSLSSIPWNYFTFSKTFSSFASNAAILSLASLFSFVRRSTSSWRI